MHFIRYSVTWVYLDPRHPTIWSRPYIQDAVIVALDLHVYWFMQQYYRPVIVSDYKV